jgi:AraC family transcriptional regulator
MRTPIEKALWFLDSHFARAVSLGEVASVCGVSRYQMSRVFSAAMGLSVTRYLRGRRLTEAARALANGAPDILAVALDAGYSSHEAFTRAFRDQFGLTPAQLRAQRHLDKVALVEPAGQQRFICAAAQSPRFELIGPLSITGLGEPLARNNFAGVPALWQRLQPHIGNIPGQVGNATYGVCTSVLSGGTGCHYLAGVEVSELSATPRELTSVRLPAQRYAVFTHRGHITTLAGTADAIWHDWLPKSGQRLGAIPNFFERYGEDFDPWTGSGDLDICLPIADEDPPGTTPHRSSSSPANSR